MAAITALSINTNPVGAETEFVNFTISSDGNQNFQSLVQQAESLATNWIKQQFVENSSIIDVSGTVVDEHNGQEVPLFTKVSRSEWRTEPKFKPWTRYFNTAVLLGFLNYQSSRSTSPMKKQLFLNRLNPN